MRPAFTLGPVLLMQGLTVNRGRPDLQSLAAETRPERFVWRVLPHAARSFAASIVVLPREQARAAAVAYLYCRMLDTYEDLYPDPAGRGAELERFAARFDGGRLPAPSPIDDRLARDDRDRLHLLLVERCAQVDAVYRTLDERTRDRITELVRSMSAGMVWSTETFARQGGVLAGEEQIALYCRNVIGYPAVFVVDLISGGECGPANREDAFEASEMIQLANITRDIEADLARGIGYHPALEPHLGCPPGDPSARETVRAVREDYMRMALGRAGAYRRLFERLDLGRTATVRTAAVLMLLFTDLHYRGCAERTGHRPWPGPGGRLGVVAGSLPALLSPRWASRVVNRVEQDFLTAAGGLHSPGPSAPAAA
ncbi:MAG: squalene/phytoene synthase family protein [Solirubrobacterales bacterium]|nr:squalene/phytoene synthase family protein [Solirubrobacterales bacterium]